MEGRFKLRISRMFRSCRSRNMLDIVQDPVFKHRDFHLLDSSSPKPRSFPFFFPSKHMESVKTREEIYKERRRRESETSVYFSSVDGERCPPASPVSPLSTFCKSQRKEKIKKKPAMKKKKSSEGKETVRTVLAVADTSSTESKGFFSSDEEREEECKTLFSSKSFSSESSETRNHLRNKARKACRRKLSDHVGFLPVGRVPMLMEGKVRDSLAVVKSSRDPYGDFRSSMLEMIMEKQIFAAQDLEQLLRCFLSLNSPHHHQIILEVFSEIWEYLFRCSSS